MAGSHPTATTTPLAGKRVLITRAAHQVANFERLLQQQGASSVAVPVIEIIAPDCWQPLDRALTQLSQYRYVILTSVNAVQAVYQRLKHLGIVDQLTGAEPSSVQWVCVGPKTAQALQQLGRDTDLQPQQYRAEAVVDLLCQQGVEGAKVLYPRAQLARELIPTELTAAGAQVDDPIAYQTVPAAGGGEKLCQLLTQHHVDIVTFTSSSSVENFVALLGADAATLTQSVVLASIGPLTTATAQRLGLHIDVEPQDYTLDGMVAALLDFYR